MNTTRRFVTMFLLTLITTHTLSLNAEPSKPSNSKILTVIALEYPPFTTESQADRGSSFRALQGYILKNDLDLQVEPLFLPPARAQSKIISGNWCASFYPPPDIVSDRGTFVQLSDTIVSLGLYRRRKPEPFVWNDLSELGGGKVALLRSKVEGSFLQQFLNAGLIVEFVGDVSIGLKMLSKGRVDYAFGDSDALNVISLPKEMRDGLQFSSSHIIDVQVGIFLNPICIEAIDIINKSSKDN